MNIEHFYKNNNKEYIALNKRKKSNIIKKKNRKEKSTRAYNLSIIILIIFVFQTLSPFFFTNTNTNRIQAANLNNNNYNLINRITPSAADDALSIHTPDIDGFIRNWLIAGTFQENESWSAFPTINGNHVNLSLYYKEGDNVISEDNPINGSDNNTKWASFNSLQSSINLSEIFEQQTMVAAYSRTYIYFPKNETNVTVFLGYNDGIRLVWDGDEKFYNHTNATFYEDRSVISIGFVSAGWHSLSLTLEVETNNWKFSVRLSKNETMFQEIPGLAISLDYQNEWPKLDNAKKIFLFDHPVNSTITGNFSASGGIITQGPWTNINGFAGTINEFDIPFFTSNITDVKIYSDKNTIIQMNTVHQQLQTINGILLNSSNSFNLTGKTNASVAVLDTGIDSSSIAFNSSYGDLNYSADIIGWQDFIDGTATPSDIQGHGTFIASVIAGYGSTTLEANHTPEGYYNITLGEHYSHQSLFYPDYVIPGEYEFKFLTLNISQSNSTLNISAILNQTTQTSELQNPIIHLYRDGVEIKTNDSNATISQDPIFLNMTYNTSQGIGVFDLSLSYEISFGQLPEFDFLANISFIPNGLKSQGSAQSEFANFTGIAPNTKIVSVKILNNSGIGQVSSLITGLEWILSNREKYHIISTTLSIGLFNANDKLVADIGNLIDKIIDNGTMVIIAAGNEGVSSTALNQLAVSNKAIVVGAVNDKDQLTYYSSRGSILNGTLRTPDILAPGGSCLIDNSMIISTDTNNGDFIDSINDGTLNDLTAATGTSISAAIISGIYSLMIEYVGGWENWNQSLYSPMLIKSILLMSATETNQLREDDPYSITYDESQNSPELNRGANDIYEGYGRVNPITALQLLNQTLEENTSKTITLSSSKSDPWGSHAIGWNITLESGEIYGFNLSIDDPLQTLDVDFYLYNSTPNEDGTPQLILSGTSATYNGEYKYYTNTGSDQTYYLVIKAISGKGQCTINVSKVNVTDNPILNNTYFTSTSDYNDTLDTITFWVNYQQNQSLPPNEIYLHINCSSTPIKMNSSIIDDGTPIQDYQNGVWYWASYHFEEVGTYEYNFTVRTGSLTGNLTNNGTNFLITINQIPRVVPFGYNTEFNQLSDTSYWEYTNNTINIAYQGSNVDVYSGWDWIYVYNFEEERKTDDFGWGAFYCGITGTSARPQHPLVDDNLQPVYSYSGVTGTYDLIGPHIFLNSSELSEPIVKMGIRVSINILDSVSIQINSNRTGWNTLEFFTNTEEDWTMVSYNLSEYMDTYIQIRIRAQFDAVADPQYNKGFMLDYISFEEKNQTNDNPPELAQPADLLFGVPINTYPYYESNGGTRFDAFSFQVAYIDADGNLPEFVFLEINNQNYTMINKYGRWDSKESGLYGYKGIVYSCNISLYGMDNRTFRFHAYDGKYYVSTPWQEEIVFNKSNIINFPLNYDLNQNQVTIIGEPFPKSPSLWISSDNSWHQVKDLGQFSNPGEWYCGVGNYMGYGANWDVSLLTKPIELGGTNEIFLTFSHQLQFDLGTAGGDYAEILLSTDLGKTWITLATYTAATGIAFVDEAIDLTPYMGETGILRFRFVSDGSGTQTPLTGWRITTIRVNINETKDYIKPEIKFLNAVQNQKINGTFQIEIYVNDNNGLDMNKLEFWVNGIRQNITMMNNIIYYSIDTTNYENGDYIEFVVVAYDNEGNRNIQKVILIVENLTSQIWKYIAIGTIIGLISLYGLHEFRQKKKRKLMASGDYIDRGSWRDRRAQAKFEREVIAQEYEAMLTRLDKEWEKKQPYKLYCKSCKKWFKSPEFEIYCPLCHKDTLYIAKYCPICKKWQFFEEEGVHKCKKCGVLLIRDYEAFRTHLLKLDREEKEEGTFGQIKKKEETKKEEGIKIEEKGEKEKKVKEEMKAEKNRVEDNKDKEEIRKLLEKIPKDELKELLKEIVIDREGNEEEEK